MVRPVADRPADLDAARRIDGLLNRIFLDPLFRGAYPADVLADTASVTDWSFVRDGDLAVINAPIDALGVNYYQPDLVSAATDARDDRTPYPTAEYVAFHTAPGPVTDMGWAVDPTGLRDVLLRIRADYGDLPMYVTENGAAYPDERRRRTAGCTTRSGSRSCAGTWPRRTRRSPPGSTCAATSSGRCWTTSSGRTGYGKRFGIVHVDYADAAAHRSRTARHWYRGVITANAV